MPIPGTRDTGPPVSCLGRILCILNSLYSTHHVVVVTDKQTGSWPALIDEAKERSIKSF